MSEYRLKIGNFAPIGSVDPKFQVEGVAPTNHSSQKTRLNDLSYGIKIWTDLSSILSQIMRLTDRQTEFSSLDCVCIPCSAVKMFKAGRGIHILRSHLNVSLCMYSARENRRRCNSGELLLLHMKFYIF